MAHFAQLDENKIVQQVIVVGNNILLDESGVEVEANGIAFCENLFGGTWLQTSFNNNFRKNFAGIGYSYDEVRNAFIPPKPYSSWLLNEDTCQWESPKPEPSGEKKYEWDESIVDWVETS